MNRDDIIRMAQQAARSDESRLLGCGIDDLERFAALVAAHEREACAKIVEANADACSTDSLAKMYLYSNATAIRARGQA